MMGLDMYSGRIAQRAASTQLASAVEGKVICLADSVLFAK